MLPLLILAVKFSGFTEALQGSSTPWECIEYWERGEKQHLLLDSSFPPGEPLFISNRKEPEVRGLERSPLSVFREREDVWIRVGG